MSSMLSDMCVNQNMTLGQEGPMIIKSTVVKEENLNFKRVNSFPVVFKTRFIKE